MHMMHGLALFPDSQIAWGRGYCRLPGDEATADCLGTRLLPLHLLHTSVLELLHPPLNHLSKFLGLLEHKGNTGKMSDGLVH